MKRWPVTDAARRAVIGRLASIMVDSTDPRSVVAAAKALMSAEAQNQADEHKVVDIGSGRIAELETIATDLGIDVAVVRRIG